MDNKGYTSIALIILAVVVIVGVGVLAYMLGQHNAQDAQSNTPIANPISTSSLASTSRQNTCKPSSPSSIMVVSPNGGEVYSGGQEITVKWETCNVDPKTPVGITLSGSPYPSDTQIFLGEWGAAGDGSQTVTIANAVIPGRYVINISTPPESAKGVEDWSDNAFQIN